MKKALLFFAAFFFFVFLSAEEVQVYEDDNMILWGERWTGQESEPEPEPEVEETPEEEKEPEKAEEAEEAASVTENMECCCDVSSETEEKPKFFYVQPAIGFGTGLSLYRPTVSVAADFLVKHSPKLNYYIGLDVEARAAIVEFEARELAVQVNAVFDFMQRNVPELKSASLWIALGADFVFYRGRDEDYWDDYFTFYCSQAWGIGVDLVFKNSVILRFALDGFVGVYPDLTILVGYRF